MNSPLGDLIRGLNPSLPPVGLMTYVVGEQSREVGFVALDIQGIGKPTFLTEEEVVAAGAPVVYAGIRSKFPQQTKAERDAAMSAVAEMGSADAPWANAEAEDEDYDCDECDCEDYDCDGCDCEDCAGVIEVND